MDFYFAKIDVMKKNLLIILFLVFCMAVSAQLSRTPIMGWSSWNHFRVNINEKMIREQADAMISSGMSDAGYRYVNIDDGYLGGRNEKGILFPNAEKFPSGMKALADYIHGKGLKAGIYSDAGSNTCGSIWDHDEKGVGVGLFGHVKQDCDLFFNQWGFDFLKVDWCGGEKQKLDEKTEYLAILKEVKSVRQDIVFNICRWQFPGEWAINAADSWRISGDISASWKSICNIIDINADLAKYASPGHFNDMDMLQVGRGMSYDEDKSHFTMWCIMLSPLLAGNDLRSMSKETIEILTNNELIAVHQDAACVQAERIKKEGTTEVWVKPLKSKVGKTKVITILNRGELPLTYTLKWSEVGLGGKIQVRDLWMHQDLGKNQDEITVNVPKHGVVVLKVGA